MPSQTKKITFDTLSLFVGRLIGLLFGIVRLKYLAIYLGLTNFGILNFATFFCSLFTVLFDFGISQLLTRELSKNLKNSSTYLGKIITLKLIVVFLASIMVGVAALLSRFSGLTNWAVLLTTIVFAVNGMSAVFLSAFQAHRKMVVVALSNIFNDLVLSVLIILLISSYPSVVTVLLFTILVALLNFVVLAIVYILQVGVPKIKVDYPFWKGFSKESLIFAISSLGISIYMYIGPTVLKYTRGDAEVGIFSSGYKLLSILTLIPMAFTQVLYPIFSDFYVNVKEKLTKSLSDSLRVMLIISIPLVVGGIILAKDIFKILFTLEFSSGIIVFQIMIIGIIVGYLNWILYTFVLAIGRQKFAMYSSLSIGFLVSLISILLIPRYGYIILPFISIFTELMLFIPVTWYLNRNGYHVFSVSYFVKPVLSSLIMGMVIVILPDMHLFFSIMTGILSYTMIMYFSQGFGPQEKEILNIFLARVFTKKNT
mgnify:CR=1 FL=1